MKMHRRLSRVLVRFSLFALFAAACPELSERVAPSAFAQSCALCAQSAKAAGNTGIRALGHGILVLLIPTLVLFLGVLGIAIRRSRSSE